MARFKIKKHTEVLERNINGKPVLKRTFYTIDKVLCFGLFRFALKFKDFGDNSLTASQILDKDKVGVKYLTPDYATQFSLKEAEIILQCIKNNPDKFIKYG